MNLREASMLLKHPYVLADVPQTWADLGCGEGLFTNALAKNLGYGSKIFAIDKDVNVFRAEQQVRVSIERVKADFELDILDIGALDGILMANSFHFVFRKIELINKLRAYFRGKESFLIVEYDTDKSNRWVPYPTSFYSLQNFFLSLGYDVVNKIHELPSRYSNGNIYSAFIQRSVS